MTWAAGDVVTVSCVGVVAYVQVAVDPAPPWATPAPRSVLVVSSKNSTLPVGTPPADVTVAVNVTGVPYPTVACDESTAVDVPTDAVITPVLTGTKLYV